jgi:hypothetical protein
LQSDQPGKQRSKYWNVAVENLSGLYRLILTLIFVGFALRLYRIAAQSVWWDEAYSLHMAREGVAVMLGLAGDATQVHWDQPPLYYGLLSLWVRLAGDSEFSLRYLSLVFGVLLLPVVYRVARDLFDRPTGLAALAVTGCLPAYVVYSQETRVYAALPLCYLLALYLVHRSLEGHHLNQLGGDGAPLRLWVALAVVEAVSLYLHYFAVLGIVYLNLFFLMARLSPWWRGGRRGFGDGRPRDGGGEQGDERRRFGDGRLRDGGGEQGDERRGLGNGRPRDGSREQGDERRGLGDGRPRDGGREQGDGSREQGDERRGLSDGRPRDGGGEQGDGGREQRDGTLRRWIGSQVLVAVLFAPWAWNMARHWDYFRSRGSIRESWVAPPGLLSFAWRVWGFFIGGNEAAVQGLALLSAGVTLLAVSCGLALLLACLIKRMRSCRLGLMLAHGLGSLALCFVAWQFWPDAHPRYTLAFSIPLFLVIGRLLALLVAPQAHPLPHSRIPILACTAGVLLVGALAVTFGTGLWAHYFDERFHKDDVRAVAAYLAEVTTAEDVILVGPDDHSVPYYYDGPATVAMGRDEPRADKVRHLQWITAGKCRLFLVHWDPSKGDLHGLRPFLLEQAGHLTAWRDFRGLDVRVYALDEDVGELPHLSQLQPGARFGPLLLTGVYYEPTTTNDNAVAVALRWRLVESTSLAYKVVVLLADAAGHRLSSADVMMLDEAGRQTYAWPVGAEGGAETVNYYVVPVPVGTPPLLHRMAVGVYDADTLERLALAGADGQSGGERELALGEVTLLPGQWFDRDPYGTWAGGDWEPPENGEVTGGVVLERFAVSPRAALPGEEVSVLLRWRATGATGNTTVPLLRLSQAGEVWAEAGSSLLAADYPFSRWSDGEVVVERRALVYPPRRGPADLALVVGDRAISLGQVWLDESRLLQEPGPGARGVGVQLGDFAELSGYRLETGELAVGRPFELTLYWRATNDVPLQTRYTVFTQLLAADGHLIAQHDGPPAGDSRPTTTWIGGEVIEDRHRLTFHDLAYTGPATLIVGLYDAETVVRVPTAQGQDHVVLPADVVVGPAEE